MVLFGNGLNYFLFFINITKINYKSNMIVRNGKKYKTVFD